MVAAPVGKKGGRGGWGKLVMLSIRSISRSVIRRKKRAGRALRLLKVDTTYTKAFSIL